MNQDYWNSVSKNYSRHILSVFENDSRAVIASRIRKASDVLGGGVAADLGCGVGMFTELLADVFSKVEACDFSATALDIAKQRCQRLMERVVFYRTDLCVDAVPFAPVDFALCVNVLLMPSLDERLRAWRAVTNQVRQGGQLLLLVPASESAQMEVFRAVEQGLDEGQSCSDAMSNGQEEHAVASDLQQGVFLLDGVRTKHYLQDELLDMLPGHEFELLEIEKFVYSSQCDSVPTGTWDWLVHARRL